MAIRQAKRGNDPLLWTNAKRLRNNCTKRLRKARADYIKENLENNIGNSKKFWKNIQDVLPNKKNRSMGNFDLYDDTNKQDIPTEETADYINNFFVNIGPKLAQRYDETWNYEGTRSETILDDIRTNLDEVIRLC